MSSLDERLIAWAQNEEMINISFTEHGVDCIAAVEVMKRRSTEIERLERELAFARETAAAFREEARRATSLLLEERQVGVADTCVYLNDR